MAKEYVLDDDMVVCTSGARQTTIHVSSQYMVRRGNGKFVATEDDRFTGCFLCQKVTAIGSSYGFIAGGILGAVVGLSLTPTMAVTGFLSGAIYGLLSGAKEGGEKGAAVGKSAGGAIGAVLGAIAAPFPLKKIGAAVGKVVGQIQGSVAGGIIGAVCNGLSKGVEDSMKGAVIGTAAPPIAVGLVGAILNGLKCSIITNMIMNVINPCSLMTKGTPWSSLHYQVKIAGKYALMPDAKIACPFAGVISITKPDWDMMLTCAKMSYWVYCTPDKYQDYEKYDPENMGWHEVTPEELERKRIVKKSDGIYQLQGSKEKIKYSSEVYNHKQRYFFTDIDYQGYQKGDNASIDSGMKMGMYEKDGHYILVARGTARKPDWVDDNLKQGVGLGSDQYDQVTAVSKTTTKKVGKRNVTITGHSMGGGTSSTAGIVTGSDTYAFDPAGVHPNTARKYGKTRMDSSNIYTIYAATDPLNNLQNNLIPIAPTSVGQRLMLNTANKLNLPHPEDFIINGHALPLLIEEIERLATMHKDDKDLMALYK